MATYSSRPAVARVFIGQLSCSADAVFILGTWYLYLRVLRLCMGEVCCKRTRQYCQSANLFICPSVPVFLSFSVLVSLSFSVCPLSMEHTVRISRVCFFVCLPVSPSLPLSLSSLSLSCSLSLSSLHSLSLSLSIICMFQHQYYTTITG